MRLSARGSHDLVELIEFAAFRAWAGRRCSSPKPYAIQVDTVNLRNPESCLMRQPVGNLNHRSALWWLGRMVFSASLSNAKCVLVP
jgi:hypothetical protein